METKDGQVTDAPPSEEQPKHKKRPRQASAPLSVAEYKQLLDNLSDDDFVSRNLVCAFFGGPASPISLSTLHRAVRDGVISPPVKGGAKAAINRWRYGDIRKDRERMEAGQ